MVGISPQADTLQHFCWLCSYVSPHWQKNSKNVSSEISKGEEGGRRGVLLPSTERCGTRTVSSTNDGSLWVTRLRLQNFETYLYIFETVSEDFLRKNDVILITAMYVGSTGTEKKVIKVFHKLLIYYQILLLINAMISSLWNMHRTNKMYKNTKL